MVPGCSGLQGDCTGGSQHATLPGRRAWNFQLLLPWLASGCTELGGSGGEDSGASTAGCSATGQMMNHRFPVCRTMEQGKSSKGDQVNFSRGQRDPPPLAPDLHWGTHTSGGAYAAQSGATGRAHTTPPHTGLAPGMPAVPSAKGNASRGHRKQR